jgi:hypothetical protein
MCGCLVRLFIYLDVWVRSLGASILHSLVYLSEQRARERQRASAPKRHVYNIIVYNRYAAGKSGALPTMETRMDRILYNNLSRELRERLYIFT